jgi:GT2 family glycosyltransferase
VSVGSNRRPSFAVAIPTYMREQVLLATIEQVLTQAPRADEILVIDQSTQHEAATTDKLAAWHRQNAIRWVRHSPANLPSARNRAIRETRCDVVLFIDDDVQMDHNLVGAHLRNYADASVAAVAGRVLDAVNPTPEERRRSWPTILDCRCLAMDAPERREGIAAVKGGNHSVRVEWARKIGGYDENYLGWAYREDADFAVRLWKAGGMVVFDPEATLTHLRAQRGGCRLQAQGEHLPEWQLSFPASYFAVRNLFPTIWFWQDVLAFNVRKYVFRKATCLRPWRLPWAAGSYLYALCKAVRLSLERNRHDVDVSDTPPRISRPEERTTTAH